jgi:hypothetical protein
MNYCPGARSEQTATRDLMNLRVATATTLAIFFIQNHDVRKRPDNQRLLPSAADSGTRAALRASRFALRRCRSAFSACFRRSVCRDIRALVSANKRVGTVLTFLELCSCTYRLLLPALLS